MPKGRPITPPPDAAPDAPREPDDRGLSLEALTAGFAELFDAGYDPYTEASDEAHNPEADDRASGPAPDVSPRTILEAMLFVGHPDNEPLDPQRIARLMRGVRPSEIDELVGQLNRQYRDEDRPYEIESVGTGYRMRLRDEFGGLRERLADRVREARLSQAAVEVLALVAYNTAMTSDDVARLRGRPSGALLSQLVRRRLLKVERPDARPRHAMYSTTERFLELFGLASLADLPRSEQVDDA